MLDYLKEVEQRLPELLQSLDGWTSKFITYEEPHVERLYRQDGPNRIFLHRIFPCTDRPFEHTHPWPAAMKIVEGWYEQEIGMGDETLMTIKHGPGSTYEMINPLAVHSVAPSTEYVLTIMVTGPKYNRFSRLYEPVVNPELTLENANKLLEDFRRYYK